MLAFRRKRAILSFGFMDMAFAHSVKPSFLEAGPAGERREYGNKRILCAQGISNVPADFSRAFAPAFGGQCRPGHAQRLFAKLCWCGWKRKPDHQHCNPRAQHAMHGRNGARGAIPGRRGQAARYHHQLRVRVAGADVWACAFRSAAALSGAAVPPHQRTRCAP